MVENPENAQRAEHEREHGEFLASVDTETVRGWGTPAGRKRADRRAKLIVEKAGLKEGVKAMEIGCGTGMFTEMFANAGAEIFAVDISPNLIAEAQKRGLSTDKVHFICERFEDVQQDEPFDAIVGSSVLHHLNMEEALDAIFQLLKPGGRFAFAEPNMLNPQVFAERTFLRKYLDYVSPDETAFVRWRLKKQLAVHGFEEISITPFDWLHPAIPQVLIPFVSWLGRIIEAIPGLREFSGSVLISGVRPKN